MTRILLSAAEITVTMSAVILLLILVNRTAGDRFTARCRYILWCIVMLRLAVPVGAPFQNTLIRLEVPAVTETASLIADAEPAYPTEPSRPDTEPDTGAASAEVPVSPDPSTITPDPQENSALPDGIDGLIFIGEQDGNDFAPMDAMPEAQEPESVSQSGKAPDPQRILQWAAVVYLIGAAGFFAFRMTEHLLTAGLLRSSRRTVSREMQAVYAEQCEQCGIRKRPMLYASARVTSPMLFGCFRPCILLPLNMNCPGKAAGILRHELIHRKRGDLWIKLICLIAQSFHWFNPLVHMAAGRCCREMELSCDEKVLDGLGEEERKEYGRIMLDVVKYCRRRYSGLTTQFNPRRNVVFERFENILDMRRKKRGAALIALMLAVSLSAGMVLSCTVQSEDAGSGENHSDDSAETAELTGTDESYKNSKPAGTERILTETELGVFQLAYRSAEAIRELYRIEYGEMLEYLTAWNRNSTLAGEEKEAKKTHEYADLARTYYREFRYAADFLERQVPGAMFASGGIRIPLAPEYSERAVLMPGVSGDVFALACEKKGDTVTEMFRITRYSADELTAVEDCELDTCYFAFDNLYYYAIQHPYHVENELRDEMIAEVKEVFLSANPGVTAVNNAVVGSLVSTLAGASYEHCWNNMKNGLWAPSVVIHADVVKGVSARLVNRMFEALERGESVAGMKVSGVELNGEIAPLADVTLPEDAVIPAPIAADQMDDYFFGSRYDGESLYYRIPMGKQYVMQIRFLLSRSVVRFQSVEICLKDGMSEKEYNSPANELYTRYRSGSLTVQRLMQYPAVHRDLLDIIAEITDNVENGDTLRRDNYSIAAAPADHEKLILPSMYQISAYFRQWEGGDIVYLYRCTAGTYARIEVTVGSSLELKEVSMGNITELIRDYGDLYALYQAGVIPREGLYTHDTVMEMGAELVNTVLSAFRRGMNPNALFAGEGYAEPVTYPGGGVIISDIQPEELKSYASGNYVGVSEVEHPYDCYRIPLHGGYRLEIWYELSEKGMRGINVRLAEVIPSSYRTLSKSVLYQKVRNGEVSLLSVLQAGTVQSDISALFDEVFDSLSRKEYTGSPEPWDFPVAQNTDVTRLIAVSSMGKPVLCYSPDGKILYEAELMLLSDEKSSHLGISCIGVRTIGERELTVLTDCFVDRERVECALTLPDLYPFDTVKVHRIRNEDGTGTWIAELICDASSVYLLADVTEVSGNVYFCDAGDNPRVLTEAEAEKLLNGSFNAIQ